MKRAAAVTLCLLVLAIAACAGDEGRVPATPGAVVAPTLAALPATASPPAVGAGAASAAPTTQPAAAATAPAATPAAVAVTATVTAVPQPLGEPATVTRVVDGDTIDVTVDGELERVRFILVDTREVYGGVECFGREASAFTSSLLAVGTAISLERDVSERDRYGRLLRYVYLPDGPMLNEVLVAEGYAAVATFPPDVKYLDRLRAAEAEAREAERGLWSACADDAPAAPAIAPTTAAAPAIATPVAAAPAAATAAAACDPSYPDVCIPVGAADYDCAGGSGNGPNYVDGPIRVLPPDPHRLDGNHDGWACG